MKLKLQTRKLGGHDTYIDEYVRIAEQRLKGEIAAPSARSDNFSTSWIRSGMRIDHQ